MNAATEGGAAGPRLTVLGTGYLGTAHAACLAGLGFEVLGVDTDSSRIGALLRGHLPFHEAGLERLLRRGVRSGRLRFTTSYEEAARFGDVHFVCVGTPQQAGSFRADLGQVDACIETLAPLLTRSCLVVGKSTVPVGTAARYAGRIARRAPAGWDAELAWNPEFLREGHAVADTLLPDRIVAGVTSRRAELILRQVYATPLAAGIPMVVTDLATAELAKAAANAFLATKISFINAMAEICEPAGADVLMLAEILGHDPRIGRAGMHPGLGFGGGCLPKDIRALMASAEDIGAGRATSFLGEIDAVNGRRRARAIELASELAGGSLAGRTVAALGLAFKPGSDDIRNSPALDVAATLGRLGARVRAYDPAAMANARREFPDLDYSESLTAAARDADVVLLLTEWPEFCKASPRALAAAVAHRNIVDGRNALDPAAWLAAGWSYRALGRPAAAAGGLPAAGGPGTPPAEARELLVG